MLFRSTERAYETPRFVENLARELAVALDGDDRLVWYDISVASAESIYCHDAFAELVRDKRS